MTSPQSSPQPAPAPPAPAPPGAASLGRRVLAYVIDGAVMVVLGILIAIIVGVVVWLLPRAALLIAGFGYLLLIAWLFVYTAMQGGRGSIGMRLLALRLARTADGSAVGFWRALLRNVIWGLAGSIVVGYFSPLFDGSGWHRGWHDKAAGTVMRDARVDAPHAQPAPAPPPGAPATGPVPPRPPAPPQATTQQAPQPQHAAPPQQAPAPHPATAPAPAPPAPNDAVPPAAAAAPPHPSAPVAPAGPASDLIAHVPGITKDAPARQSPPDAPVAADPASAAAAPAPPVADDSGALDETILRADLRAPAAAPVRAGIALVWDDGARNAIGTRALFGRNPATEAGAEAIVVADETLSLSKTHFELDVQDGFWITDRHSTNGVVVVRDGERLACPPGERMALQPGDTLEIGTRTATVEETA